MNHILALTLAACGATQVWVAGPHETVLPTTVRLTQADTALRLYMARGETESFQIVVRADKEGVEYVRIEPELTWAFPDPPEIREVQYLYINRNEAPGAPRLIPGPLESYEERPIPPDQTRAFWITYKAPEDLRPGIYSTTIDVRTAKRRKKTVRLTLEVFGFEMPESPTLGSLFSLDRGAIGRRYGLDTYDLTQWISHYDILARYPISYTPWGQSSFLDAVRDEELVKSLEEHLTYVVRRSHMNTVALADLAWLSNATVEIGEQMIDVLDAWSSRLDLGVRPVVWATLPSERRMWSTLIQRLFALRQRAPGLERLLIGSPHPYFQAFAEAWAVSIPEFHPDAHNLMSNGRSIRFVQEHPASVVRTSERRRMGIDPSYSADLYDGSLFTEWISDASRGETASKWIELVFVEPVTTDSLRIAWVNGMTANVVRLQTSREGRRLTDATVRWSHSAAGDAYDFPWTDGEFRVRKTFRNLRIEFDGIARDARFGIAEIMIGGRPVYETLPSDQRVKPWLDFSRSAALVNGTSHLRLVPWLCWSQEMTGFVGGSLNSWPEAWRSEESGTTTRFSVSDLHSVPLVYPGRRGLIPSVQLEHLRDGLEDYEYLRAFTQIATEAPAKVSELRAQVQAQWPDLQIKPDELLEYIAWINETRIALGRELSRGAKDLQQRKSEE